MNTTSDRDAFVRAIIAEPDEDAPRLVFADWLDEHGEPERAEFIRVQCERARREADGEPIAAMSREHELFAVHQQRWLDELPTPAGVRWTPDNSDVNSSDRWARGFASQVWFDSPDCFREHAETIFSVTPVDEVRFRGLNTRDVERLADLPQLAHVRGLGVDSGVDADALPVLLRSPHLSGLRRLSLLSGSVDAESLSLIAGFSSLQRLELCEGWLNDDDLRTFAEQARLERLERLSLSRNRIGDAGVVALIEGVGTPALRWLDVSSNCIGDVGARALLACTRLRYVGLSRNYLGTSEPVRVPPQPIVEEPTPSRTLDLDANPLLDAHLAALGTWPGLEQVWHLSLQGNSFTADGLREFARSPRLVNLRTLTIERSQIIDPHGLEALLLSPHLGGLTRLTVSVLEPWNEPRSPNQEPRSADARRVELDIAALSHAAARWLADSSCFSRVVGLSLGGTFWGDMSVDENVRILGQSPALVGLRFLAMTPNRESDLTGHAVADFVHQIGVRRLRFGKHSFGPRGFSFAVKVFAESPHLAELESLDLREVELSARDADLLRERFGKRVLLPASILGGRSA